MKIGIVTDSTADLTPEYYKENDVVMVPLTVHFGDKVYKDWVDMPPDRFYPTMEASVAAGILPKTSQPPAGDFVEAYQGLAQIGVDHIISIHISAKLSGTMQSAKGATGIFKDVPVTLIDSEITAGLLGSFVKKLVEARAGGADIEEMIAVANRCKEWGKLFFTVKTLKYLRTWRAYRQGVGAVGNPAIGQTSLDAGRRRRQRERKSFGDQQGYQRDGGLS